VSVTASRLSTPKSFCWGVRRSIRKSSDANLGDESQWQETRAGAVTETRAVKDYTTSVARSVLHGWPWGASGISLAHVCWYQTQRPVRRSNEDRWCLDQSTDVPSCSAGISSLLFTCATLTPIGWARVRTYYEVPVFLVCATLFVCPCGRMYVLFRCATALSMWPMKTEPNVLCGGYGRQAKASEAKPPDERKTGTYYISFSV